MPEEEKVIDAEVLPAKIADPLTGVNVQALIGKALERESPLEVMERLMVMRREIMEEAAKMAFYASLAAFQAECPVIPKTKKVYFNNQLRYSYAPLDAIVGAVRKPLETHGFSYAIQTEQTETTVTAICIARHKQGHSETSRFTVPIEVGAKMNEAQKTASALTYAKRYAFCDTFGILTGDEDDDARHSDHEHAAGQQSDGKKYGTCPECGKAAVIKGKEQYGGGWLCWKKKGGCGAKFDKNPEDFLDGKPQDSPKNAQKPPEKAPEGKEPMSTLKQQGYVHKLLEDLGYSDTDYRKGLMGMFGVKSSKDLTRKQVSELIEKLKGNMESRDGLPVDAAFDTDQGVGRDDEQPPIDAYDEDLPF